MPNRTDHGQITRVIGIRWAVARAAGSLPDPDDPKIIYASGVYGSVVRCDRRTSSARTSRLADVELRIEINQRSIVIPGLRFWSVRHWRRHTLYFGSTVVMKTTDGGFHWEQISPDFTGAVTGIDFNGRSAGPITTQNAKERGFGVMYTSLPRRCRR